MLHVQNSPEFSVITVREALDVESAQALTGAIANAESLPWPIVVSLADCKYCDSSGLRALMQTKALLGDRLSVVAPLGRSVRRTFEITGLVRTLSPFESIADALAVPALR
jgi:anti-anti-sigma factor